MKKYVVPSMEIIDIRNDAIYTALDLYPLLGGDQCKWDNGGSCPGHDHGACPNNTSGNHCESDCTPNK